jgi:chaperonin GroES
VGPGITNRDGKLIPVNVKVGDRVLLPEYGGHSVKLSSVKEEEDLYVLYRDEDILGKLQ